MQREEIKQKDQEIFRDVFGDDTIEITDSLTAEDVEEWDSFTNVEMVARLEKEFNIEFAISEVQDLEDVGGLLDLLEKKLKG